MAHTVDVDAMLDSMEPRQFEEWMAYDAVEPFGGEWEQAGTVAAAALNAALLKVDGELMVPRQFMPPEFKTREERRLEEEAKQRYEQAVQAERAEKAE